MKSHKILDMLMQGIAPHVIAKEAGVSAQTVYSLRTNYNLPKSRELRDQAVARLFAEGLDDETIATRLYIEPQTVRRTRCRLGLKRRTDHSISLANVDWSKDNLTIVKETGVPYSSVAYWRQQHAKTH